MTAVTAAHSQPQAAAEVRICSLSPAPARWAMTTEKPLVIRQLLYPHQPAHDHCVSHAVYLLEQASYKKRDRKP